MREILRWLLFSAGVIVATAAQAEVMDKEPSILAHWLSAVVLGDGVGGQARLLLQSVS